MLAGSRLRTTLGKAELHLYNGQMFSLPLKDCLSTKLTRQPWIQAIHI